MTRNQFLALWLSIAAYGLEAPHFGGLVAQVIYMVLLIVTYVGSFVFVAKAILEFKP